MKWRGLSKEASSAPTAVPLRERLLEIKAGVAQYVRPENQAVNQRATEAIRASGIAERALRISAPAPEFTLPDQNGKLVSSKELLAQGPLIVSFFRGRWCPFCMTEIEAWRDILPHVKSAGANVVAISPQLQRHNSFTADQHKPGFPLLSDSGNQVARAFGIVYPVGEEQKSLYKAVFVNLPNSNGDESWELPLPATFLIGQDGVIRGTWVSADYMERPEPGDVLAALA